MIVLLIIAVVAIDVIVLLKWFWDLIFESGYITKWQKGKERDRDLQYAGGLVFFNVFAVGIIVWLF